MRPACGEPCRRPASTVTTVSNRDFDAPQDDGSGFPRRQLHLSSRCGRHGTAAADLPLMDGLAQVQSRIAEIQAQLAPLVARPRATSTDWASAATAAGLGQNAPLPSPNAVSSSAGASSLALPVAGTAGGSALVAKALEYLGVPYLWGGTDPTKGLDCSGFTQLVYKSQGIDLPRVSAQQATAGRAVPSMAEARPGDLLFFDYSPERPGIDHVGIYMGDGKMIAAPQPGDVVKIQSVGDPTVIRRVP